MTPAISLLNEHGIKHWVHEYQHDPASSSYGLEAADKLGVQAGRIFKTLIISSQQGRHGVGVIPVEQRLQLKTMATALDEKKVSMADPSSIHRLTGYVVGGVSPIGQIRRHPTLIDESAKNFETIFVSAGRRGLEIELSPYDLKTATRAQFANLTDTSS